jgi:hypothetical protein
MASPTVKAGGAEGVPEEHEAENIAASGSNIMVVLVRGMRYLQMQTVVVCARAA